MSYPQPWGNWPASTACGVTVARITGDLRYRYKPGSRIVCGQGTDTGFSSTGDAEWHMVTLIMKLGLREGEVSTLISISTGDEPGTVPDGRFVLSYKLCGTCAEERGVPVALTLDGGDGALHRPRRLSLMRLLRFMLRRGGENHD
jgi:hypothetical protein